MADAPRRMFFGGAQDYAARTQCPAILSSTSCRCDKDAGHLGRHKHDSYAHGDPLGGIVQWGSIRRAPRKGDA